jgi:hypothetical protein
MDPDEIPSFTDIKIKNSKIHEIMQPILSNQKLYENFKLFAQKNCFQEQLEAYELYLNIFQTNDLKEQFKIIKQLSNDFVSPNGSKSLTLGHVKEKKFEKLFLENSGKCLDIIIKEVQETLTSGFSKFELDENISNLEATIVEQSEIFCVSFEEITKNEEILKKFSTFVKSNFGEFLIGCLDSLSIGIEWNEIMSYYIEKNSKQPILHDPNFREQIISKQKNLKDFIFEILKSEYHQRFVNSSIWKNYLHDSFKKKETMKQFNQLYEIVKTEKIKETLSESYEIFQVKNKITNQLYKGKRVKTSQMLAEKEIEKMLSFDYHPNLLSVVDILDENLENYNESSFTIITKEYNENLQDFIGSLKKPMNSFVTSLI